MARNLAEERLWWVETVYRDRQLARPTNGRLPRPEWLSSLAQAHALAVEYLEDVFCFLLAKRDPHEQPRYSVEAARRLTFAAAMLVPLLPEAVTTRRLAYALDGLVLALAGDDS